MRRKITSYLLAGAVTLAITSFTQNAHAGSFSIQVGNHHGSHHHVRHYSPPKHRCTYRTIAVERYYYDDCGYRVYYTDYQKVKTCDSYHRKHQRHKNSRRYDRGHYGHSSHHQTYSTHRTYRPSHTVHFGYRR
jgi:hypothetical protein